MTFVVSFSFCVKGGLHVINSIPDSNFMEIAYSEAEHSTCLRRKVGCVLFPGLYRGSNGAPSKIPSCTETNTCIRNNLGCNSGVMSELCSGVHAEQRALLKVSQKVKPEIAYVTHKPCSTCLKMLIEAGITEVVYHQDYPNDLTDILADLAGIKLRKVEYLNV